MALASMPSTLNLGYVRLADAICFCKNSLLFCAFSNGGNIRVTKPSIPMVKAVVMAALIACIFIVVCLCSYSKMIWINAGRIVASVHDYLATRYFLSSKKFVSVSVSADRDFAGHEKDAISVSITSPLPKPARIGLFNAIKKNVLWLENRIVIYCSCSPRNVIATLAQFACNGFFSPAFYTGKRSSHLVCHRASK